MALPCELHAQPAVSQVSGSFFADSQLIITGAGFGAKARPAPLVWEDFNGGTDGGAVPDLAGWIKYPGSGSVNGGWLEADKAYGGSGLSAYNTPLTNGFNTSYRVFPGADEIYVSWMQRYDFTGSVPNVLKYVRIGEASDPYSGPVCSAYLIDRADNYSHILTRRDSNESNVYNDAIPTGASGVWYRHEFWKKLSSPAGAANGMIAAWVDGAPVSTATRSNVITLAAGYTDKIETILLGLEGANNTSTTLEMRNDNLYVDNTRARVMVSASQTMAPGSRSEIQIPYAWNNDSISVTVNRGTFTADTPLYLFVIDSSGRLSNGYLLQAGADPGPPGPPSQPIKSGP